MGESNDNKRVITDVYGKPGRFWDLHTDLIGPSQPSSRLKKLLGAGLAYNLIGIIAAIRIFFRRRHYDGIVTSGGASGIFLGLMQWLIPWGRKPHVMVDCNWYLSGSAWKNWIKRFHLRLISPSVHRFVVWANHEIEDYSDAFGIPQEKLEYVPFHSTMEGYEYCPRDEGYLFAGGNYDRDYGTLVNAVCGLKLPVWIATTIPENMNGINLPEHVRIEGTTEAGFRQAIAAAKLVVVPMANGLLHSGGQQTCLNSMLLGKPTIAVGRKWAVDLIEDKVDGLIVDYGDVAGLRKAISWVIENPDKAADLAVAGKRKAEKFTTQATMEAIYRLVTMQQETRATGEQIKLLTS